MRNRSINGLLASAVLVASLHGFAWSTDIPVNKNGGRYIYPTIASALGAAVPGDRILLSSDTREPGFTINKNNITIMAVPEGSSKPIYLTTPGGINITCVSTEINGTCLKNLDIYAQPYGRCVKLATDASLNMINCRMESSSQPAYYGIDDYGSYALSIYNSQCFGINRGVDAQDAECIGVSNSVFNNSDININFYGSVYSNNGNLQSALLVRYNSFNSQGYGNRNIRSSWLPTNQTASLSISNNYFGISGESAYNLAFEGKNRGNLYDNNFWSCPYVAWYYTGQFDVWASGNTTTQSCRLPY